MMTRYAIVFNGVVNSTPEYELSPQFAPTIECIELPDGSPVAAGWQYDGAVFSEPEPVATDWPALIAARRYEAEAGGIEIAGMHVDTDDRSKLLINGAALEAMLDPAYTMQWKTPAGFVQLDAAQVLAVASAVRAHTQACFDREAVLLGELEDGTLTPEMLEEGWPNEPLPESAPS